MAKDDNLGDYLTDIADAIRAKKGTSEPINAQDFASEIASIQGGGSNQRVMYIRRNQTGYIDTGVSGANSNLTIRIKYAMRTFPSGYYNLVGAYKDEDTNSTRILLNGKTTVLASLNSVAKSSVSVNVSSRYTNVIYTDAVMPNTSSNYKLVANGSTQTMNRTNGNALTSNIRILNGGTDVVDVDIYHIEILDGSTLVRNFIPDYRNGEFGLYDTVNKKFYGNDGNGEFSGEFVTIE